jgi:hypothetical protein
LTTWQIKLLSAIGVIALISGLLLVIKYQRDIINKQTDIQNSIVNFKKLPDNVVRDQTQYASPADLDKLAASLDLKLGPIQDDLKSLKANITGIQTITVNSNGETKTNVASTTTTPRTDPIPANEPVDQYGYNKNKQTLVLTEPFGKTDVPIGQVSFSAWQEKPFDVQLEPRQYTAINILGTDENGKTYTYSKFAVKVDGKVYDIDIADAKLVEELPEPKFRFSPRIYIGADFGTLVSEPQFQFVPNLELMLFSRGLTSTYPTWTFLGLGAGFSVNTKNVEFLMSPVSYNVGQYIPFLKNLYISTDVGLNTHAQFSVFGGLKVGL